MLGEKGAEYLSRCEYVNLEFIDLRKNGLQNEGLKHISNAKWPKLEQLLLSIHCLNQIATTSAASE